MDVDHLILDILGYRKIEEFLQTHGEKRGLREKRDTLYGLLQGTIFGTYDKRRAHRRFYFPDFPPVEKTSDKVLMRSQAPQREVISQEYTIHYCHGFCGYRFEKIQKTLENMGVTVGEVQWHTRYIRFIEFKQTELHFVVHGTTGHNNSRIVDVTFSAESPLVERVNATVGSYRTLLQRLNVPS